MKEAFGGLSVALRTANRKVSLHTPESRWGEQSFLENLSVPKKGRSFCLRLGPYYLRLVFAAYGRLVWYFLLTVEIGLVIFCLRWKISLVFFAYRAWAVLLMAPPS